jgi:hypothetical protein
MKKIITILLLSLTTLVQAQDRRIIEKEVIAKTFDGYRYIIAFTDGQTYYASFGQYSISEPGDTIIFKRGIFKVKFIEVKKTKK